MEFEVNKIIVGDALEVLRGFPAGSINCCISSPPYWGLRDYGVDGQLGLEPTFEKYIDKLCTIYDEVKRVLRKDGTCWVNLGDTYSGSTQGGGDRSKAVDGGGKRLKDQIESQSHINCRPNNIPVKSLCLIPQRFAIEMVNRGWILRNVIIWHKPNPMPSSAKDRFTVDFEYVFFFVKSKRYWFEPQYEPYQQSSFERMRYPVYGEGTKGKDGNYAIQPDAEYNENPLGRNKRCVWTIPTQPCPEAHFATFPDKLVEPMIKAGCPEFVCKKCGNAREKIWERVKGHDWNIHKTEEDKMIMGCGTGADYDYERINTPPKFKGYTDCGCNAGWRPGVCLDMFLRDGDCTSKSGKIAA